MRERWDVAHQHEYICWDSTRLFKSKKYLGQKKLYWQKIILKNLPFRIYEGMRVLDVGCGPTGIALALKKGEICGIDPLMNYFAKNFVLPLNCEYICGKIENFNCRKKFDVIFALQVLDHVDLLSKTVEKLTLLTRENGYLVIEMRFHNYHFFKWWFKAFSRYIDPCHPYALTIEDVVRMLSPYFTLVSLKANPRKNWAFTQGLESEPKTKIGIKTILNLIVHPLKIPIKLAGIYGIKYDTWDVGDKSIFTNHILVFKKSARTDRKAQSMHVRAHIKKTENEDKSLPIQVQRKPKMKINIGYFSLSSTKDRIRYYLSQGNVLAHLIDRTKWHVFPKLHITPDFPTHIDIEASSRCQMRCPMCGQKRMSSEMKGVMDFELYKKIIDECAARNVYSVKLSWRGEPLLNPKLFDMIRYAKINGIKDVAFLTNVEAFDDEKTKKLVDSGCDWISCSIDGLGEIYERIRYPATFEETIEKVKKIVALRNRMGKNKPLVRVQTIFSAIKENPAEYRDFWEPIADQINFIANQIRQTDDKKFQRNPNYVCPSCWQRMCIDFRGIVPQCHSDYLEKNILGDVKKQSLYEIWHGEAFKKVRELQKNKRRLELQPCWECADGGITEEIVIDIRGKKQKIIKYVGQDLDIDGMDARPQFKKKVRE